jgi:hypothetical protein
MLRLGMIRILRLSCHFSRKNLGRMHYLVLTPKWVDPHRGFDVRRVSAVGPESGC